MCSIFAVIDCCCMYVVCVWTRILVALCLSRLGFVVCVCGFGFCLHSAFFWLGCSSVWPLACAASVSRHLLVWPPVTWGCAGAAVGGVCLPPSPFFYFFWAAGGGGFRPCRFGGFMSPAACPGLGSLGLRPPLPFRLGHVHVFFFCPPLLQWSVCRRVRVFFFQDVTNFIRALTVRR